MKRWMLVVLLLLGLGGLATLAVRAEDKAKEKNEAKIKLEDCPKAVQDTIKKEAAGGTIGEVEKETKDAKTVYEAKVTLDGKKTELQVAEDGKLLKKKAADDDKDEKDEQGEHEDED